MNFDDLQDAWAAAQPAENPSSIERLPFEKTFPAITRIRRNMKNEFIAAGLAFLVIIILFLLLSKTGVSVIMVIISSFIWLMQSGYYFWRFYIFYRQISRSDLSLKKSVRKFVYELELNIETYKTYSFCATPLVTLTGLAILAPSGVRLWLIVLILLIGQIVSSIWVNWHIKIRYGRYLKELKTLMDDLDAED
jgi:hypothetical protein